MREPPYTLNHTHMNYYLDFEFIEGFHKPFLGKRRHFIDLISVGIVCEDGREYYAISNEFKAKNASQWVKENVISKLPPRYDWEEVGGPVSPFTTGSFEEPSMRLVENRLYKSNKQIADEIAEFCGCFREQLFWRTNQPVNFYGYYADYDWVLFCSLFGTMMDLPKGFPKLCMDLKQTCIEKFTTYVNLPGESHGDHKIWTPYYHHPNYPPQSNEHNALDDARWNKKLHEFIKTLSVNPKPFEPLFQSLRTDPELFRAYKDNIAMAFKDEFSLHGYADPDGLKRDQTEFVHRVANEAAENFLKLLIK